MSTPRHTITTMFPEPSIPPSMLHVPTPALFADEPVGPTTLDYILHLEDTNREMEARAVEAMGVLQAALRAGDLNAAERALAELGGER